MARALSDLTTRQQELLRTWLPHAVVLHDHSWGLVETTVLEVRQDRERYIVKAGGASDGHIGRELDAHERWLTPWVERNRAARLAFADRDAKILVTHYLPGTLLEGTPAQSDPETFRQTGELLALLHAQPGALDHDLEAAEDAKALERLTMPHRIEPATVSRLAAVIGSWGAASVLVVPTHGDWQPRNWLIDGDIVRIIDFGRAALRPASTDLIRLKAQDFLRDATGELAAAFVDGYGSDPSDSDAFRRAQLREGIGTAVWAYAVGDRPFEEQGHRMIAAGLADWS